MNSNPDYYKHSNGCSSGIHNIDFEDMLNRQHITLTPEELIFYKKCLLLIIDRNPSNRKEYDHILQELRRTFKKERKLDGTVYIIKKAFIIQASIQLNMDLPPEIKQINIKKPEKSASGVLVITVLTSPNPIINGKIQKFTCEWNCYMCPNEPGQPRSYLHDEPAVLRANRNSFDPIMQFTERCKVLEMNGHTIDKIELIILGGTWTSYPHEYQNTFIRDLFYAANTYNQLINKPLPKSLFEEKKENEIANVKIIGMTLETRPDCINALELKRMRLYGCTRVALGLQHTNDQILKNINRECTRKDIIRAIKLLKDCMFKIELHIMPNLPGTTVELDYEMFQELIKSEDFQGDQWKIYPCDIVPWTVIMKMYNDGTYIPYSSEKVMNLIEDIGPYIPEWIRLVRVKRDIPSQYIAKDKIDIESIINKPNLRENVENLWISKGIKCKDIRSREVKLKTELINQAIIKHRTYKSSGGIEHFISFETPDESTIFAFLRLRLSSEAGGFDDGICNITTQGRKITRFIENDNKPQIVFPELKNTALIRELHTYGKLSSVNEKGTQQHIGFGKQLMTYTENFVFKLGYKQIAVISGVGTRGYYKKLGYKLDNGSGEFMIKKLKSNFNINYIIYILVICISYLFLFKN